MELSEKQIEAAAKTIYEMEEAGSIDRGEMPTWADLDDDDRDAMRFIARRTLITAALAQSPEDGAAGVKPFDLARVLKHAFFSGFECASSYGDPAHHWVDYDPEGFPAYQRIRSALTPAQHQTRAAAQKPVAHAYVVDGECEQIEWGTNASLPDDPALVFLYKSHLPTAPTSEDE